MNNAFNDPQPNGLRTAEHSQHRARLEPLISAYQDNEVTPDEKREVEEYLHTCAACRQTLAEYSNIWATLNAFYQNSPKPARPLSVAVTPKAAPLPTRAGRPTPSRVFGGFSTAIAAVAVAFVVVMVALVFFVSNKGQPTVSSNSPVAGSISTALVSESVPIITTTAAPTTTVPVTTEPPETTVIAPVVTSAPASTQPVAPSTEATNPPMTSAAPVVETPAATTAPAPPRTTAAPAATTAPPVKVTTAPPTPADKKPTPEATTRAPIATTAPPAPTSVQTRPNLPPVETPDPPATTPAPLPTTVAPVTTEPPTPTPTPDNNPVLASSAPTVQERGLLAYISAEDGEIHLVSSDGKNDRLLSTKASKALPLINWRELSWSPDGKWIAATGQGANGNYSIWLFKIADAPDARPDFVAEGISAVWSPDPTDTWMSFLAGPISVKNNVRFGKPSTVQLKGSNPITGRDIYTLSEDVESIVPQWFHDNKRVLVGQDRVMTRDGKVLKTFSLFENVCAAASLSPVGDKLVVLKENNGIWTPLVYDANGPLGKNSERSLEAQFVGRVGRGTDCGAYRVQWLPDGSAFYFYYSEGQKAGTYVVNVTDSSKKWLLGTYTPSFNYRTTAYTDTTLEGGVYAAYFGDRPQRPAIMARSKYPPVWQPTE